MIAPDAAPIDPWKHRSANMRCASCMWYAAKVADDGSAKIGRCRRHAPVMGGFPAVFPSDWCGDHRIDENRA